MWKDSWRNPLFHIAKVLHMDGRLELMTRLSNKMVHSNSLPFYPLLACMRCLGIELVPPSEAGSSIQSDRYKTLTLGVIFLLLNAFCSSYTTVMNCTGITGNSSTVLYSLVNDSSADGSNSTTRMSAVMSWNIIIDCVNFGILVVVVHATLLSFTHQEQWRLLWKNIQRMDREFKAIRTTIHHFTIIGLLVVISETIVMASTELAFVKLEPGERGLLPTLFPVLFRLCAMSFHLYAGCGLLLFALIGWTALLGYRHLHEQVATSSRTCQSLAANELAMLAKWKRLYVLLSDVVDGMNECFGPILLFWIIHIFVGFIATPYYILDGFHDSVNAGPIMLAVGVYLMIQHAFHLLIITGIPSGIRQQAIAIGKQLQQLIHQDSNHLQEEVNMLATQVLISVPRVTAMGYANLELSLIPTLIGTTLTYLVILCQFEVSEEI